MSGVDEHAVGPAGDLEVAFGFELGGGLVIDDLVGAEDVIAVMHDDMAVEGEDVADVRLAVGVELDGHSGCGCGLRLRDR